jgi:hypothetical protein
MEDKTFPEKKIVELEYDKNTTVQELLEKSEESCADLSNYYNLSRSLCFNNRFFPYIISTNGRILFNQSYCETKVIDFLHTHKVNNEFIYADTGIPQAGGPDLKDLYDMWTQVYPILDQIGTMVGLFLGSKEFIKWIKSVFKKKPLPPQTVFELLLSKSQWNHIELSDELSLDVDDVKKLLHLSDFKWDKTKMLYVFNGDIEKTKEKLSKISIYDHG